MSGDRLAAVAVVTVTVATVATVVTVRAVTAAGMLERARRAVLLVASLLSCKSPLPRASG